MVGARGEGRLVMSLERRRCLAVATRAGKGGEARCVERRALMKCGEGVGRPEEVRAAVRLLVVGPMGFAMIVSLLWWRMMSLLKGGKSVSLVLCISALLNHTSRL